MTNSMTALVGNREVTIQVLRVDSKKMTMQFFRQIPSVPYFAQGSEPDSSLLSWGRVVYPIVKEGREWLLAERDNSLFRCCIDLPNTSDWAIGYHAKGIEDARVQLAGYVGNPHLGGLAKLVADRLNQHTVELKASSERLDLSKRRVAALEPLRQLPQIYIA